MFIEGEHPDLQDDQEDIDPSDLDEEVSGENTIEEKRIQFDNEFMLRRMNRLPIDDPERINIKHEIAEANKRLVWDVINKRFRLSLDDRAEIEAVGFAELVHSIDKFDATKGFKFSTFASSNIYFAIRTFLAKKVNENSVHIPEREKDVLRSARILIDEFVQQYHRTPSQADLFDIFDRLIPKTQSESASTQVTIDKKRADRIMALIGVLDGGGTVSLDSFASGDTDDPSPRTLLERVSDDFDTSEAALMNLDREKIRMACAILSAKERDVIELKLGMSGSEPMTYEAIGVKYDVSRERIRQRFKKAADKIYRYLKKNNIEISG